MYGYRGTKRGDLDPWTEPEPEEPRRIRHKYVPNPGDQLPPGVRWHHSTGKYQAVVKYKGRARHGGTHETPEAAAQAAQELRAQIMQEDPSWGRLKPCGTHAAFQRHHRNGEPACEPCKKAETAYITAMRKQRLQAA